MSSTPDGVLHRRDLTLAAGVAILVTLLGAGLARATPPAGKHEEIPPGPRPAEPPAQGYTPCVDGNAGAYPCSGVDLLSFVPISALGGGDQDTGNDVWGWTDPFTGREYALMGLANGTAFVDVSDPRHPTVLGLMPGEAPPSPWRDIKVYRDHAFVVADRAPGHGLQVFDLTRLRGASGDPAQTFDPDTVYREFGSAHNLAVDEESGFAYAVGSDTCEGGLHIVDVRDPRHPMQAGCFAADGYTHDAQCMVYRGPDGRYQGRQICLAANEDTVTLVDTTDKAAPRTISRTSYEGVGYTHQAWFTEDHRQFLVDDEFDEVQGNHGTRTYVWDATDLEQPFVLGAYTASTPARDHNQYVLGNRVFQANYRAGIRVLSLDRVTAGQLSEEGFFDVFPADDEPEFSGTWSVFPFFASGIFVASGIEQGLYVLGMAEGRVEVPHHCTPSPTTMCLGDGRFSLSASYVNQFNGRGGAARAHPASELAGYFSFDDPQNLELMVKLLDFGEHTLVFYGQLTNLHTRLEIRDSLTGDIRTYRNGTNNCGGIDRHGFANDDHHDVDGDPPAGVGGPAETRPGRGLAAPFRLAPRKLKRPHGSGVRPPRPRPGNACTPDATTLCLLDGRYAVELDWHNQYTGAGGDGVAAPLSGFAGSFAFDDPRNVEVVVKTLDFGDRTLVLWGSLSDLEYALSVRETASGATRRYENPAGTYCGGLDSRAFER